MQIPKLKDNFYTSDTSKALAMMRFPLALCIVAVHWFQQAGNYAEQILTDISNPITDAVVKFVNVFLADNGVGSFFFISGYLFFAGGVMTGKRYGQKLRKRVRTLLIPYILWNALFVGFILMHQLPVLRDIFPGTAARGDDMSLWHFITGMFFHLSPHNANLWFIRELMVCVLLVPILYPILKRWPVTLLILSGIGFVFCQSTHQQYPLNLCESIFFFSLGATLSIKECDLVALTKGKGYLMLTLYLLFGVGYWLMLDATDWSFALKFLSIPCLLMTVIALCGNLVSRGYRANAMLTASTFFVYVAHPFVLMHSSTVIQHGLHITSDWGCAISYIIGYVVLVILLVAGYMLLRKISPGLTNILTGRRNSGAAASSTVVQTEAQTN